MRRIAIALILIAAVVGIHACAADAPSAPKPGSGGGTTSSALSIQLFTNDANPKAGTCTLVEAIVALNGTPVPDGTSVNFATDFGTFGQNGLPLVSVVTTGGTAVTAICGPGAGTAKLKATASSGGKTNSATLSVAFQPDSGTLPFVSFCNPSFGPKEGGTILTLNGGRFFGSASTTRVTFTANGVPKDGIVTSVTSTAITVQTPGFPELGSPSVQAPITVTLGTNLPTPVVLSLPSCFVYGSVDSGTPSVTAVLPSSGTKSGHTRVTIIGSGFATSGVQVFFGAAEATVVSVSYNQVIVLSPPAPFGAGENVSETVTVKNINSGVVSSQGVNFLYTPDVHIVSMSNGTQRVDQPFFPVTIFGTGFQAPMAVSLAGIPAFVQSVSATEIVVLPGTPLLAACSNISGGVVVVNLDTGDGASNPDLVFTYVVPQLAITSVAPQTGTAGTQVGITGSNFPLTFADADVKFGSRAAFVQSIVPGSSVVVSAPASTVTTAPSCTGSNPVNTLQTVETVDVTVTNRANTCSATAAQAFSYQLPCVIPTPAGP
jgi:hypothetical protein